MIVLATQALKLATAALPLLFSVRGALPSGSVEPLVERASGAVLSVLELATSIEHAGLWRARARSAGTVTTAASVSDPSRPVAGATLEPPASGATGTTGAASGPKAKRGKTAASGGTGAIGATGASGASETSGAAGESGRMDHDHHGDGEGDSEDGRGDEDRNAMRRSSTPDVSFGMNPVHVQAGEYHRGDMVCVGGELTIDGEVHGDVTVIGGVLTISGRVGGNVVAVGSKVHLHDTAVIRHDFVSVSGPVDRASNARIGGEYHSIDLPNLGRFATGHGVFLYLFSLFLWIGVIVTAIRFMAVLVVAAIAPGRVEGALSAPRISWIFAFFLGFVVHLFAGIVSLLLIIGIVTSPIGFALWLGVRVVVWMGLAAIYLEVGRNFSQTAFGKSLSYFGSILLGFTIFALLGMIPILGWFVSGILSSTALGLMLLTRFGGRGRQAQPAVLTPAPPAPAAPPIAATSTAAPPGGAAPQSAV